MKKRLIISILSLLGNFMCYAINFTVDGINYTTTGANTVKVVKGTYTGSITLPPSVMYSSISYSVTAISDMAFQQCTNLTSINLPTSLTTIGVYAFEKCTSLISIVIPSSVTTIYSGAFSGCSGLTSILLPSTLTTLGYGVLEYCTGLTTITIPNSITIIPKNTFLGCTSLTTINLPTTITSINEYAFSSCKALKSFIVPSSVTTIGPYVFYSSINLSSISIPASVTSIDLLAFKYCNALINVDSNNSAYSSKDGAIFNKGFTEIILCPDQIASSLVIPTTVTTIGDSAFFENLAIQNFTVPSTIKTIGKSAFSGCKNLTKVNLPSSLTLIDNYAFYNTNDNMKVYVSASTPPLLSGDYVFSPIMYQNQSLYVPSGFLSVYGSSDWYRFFRWWIYEFVPTSINSLYVGKMDIYPNPANGIINIDLGDTSDIQFLRVYNVNGQKIFETNQIEKLNQLDVSNFSTGVYNIQSLNKKNEILHNGKFMKKNM